MKGILCFADGSVYTGLGLGIEGESSGQLVHFHGPLDPQFILTDPAVKDLLILSTEPVLGGCGVRSGMDQSDNIWAAGLLCREIVDFPTHEGHFKNIHRMLESHGGMAVTYLDPDPLAELAAGEPGATVLIGPEGRLSKASRRIIVEELRRDSPIGMWDDKASVRRTTELECTDPGGRILLIDLGIRNGMLRFLREHYHVRIINPAGIDSERSLVSYDGIVISGGPGQTPTDELIGYISRITGGEHPPIYAYGIGSLALGISFGMETKKMDRAHRGMSVPVSIGDAVIPTYQTHSHTLHPPDDEWSAAGTCPVDGSLESLISREGSIFLSMYDPAPDLRRLHPSDPLALFIGSIRKENGREDP